MVEEAMASAIIFFFFHVKNSIYLFCCLPVSIISFIAVIASRLKSTSALRFF